VVATGTAPLAYQWQKNGVNIPGATSSSYTTAATTADNGSTFDVVVSNTAGSVTSSTVTLTVTPATQTITFPQPPDTALTAGPVTLTATASSTLAVSYTSTTLPVCTVSGSSVTLVSVGTCSITANQAGNANFAAAAPVSKSFQVLQSTQTITFAALPSVTYGVGAMTLRATASSGLPVSYLVTGPATVSGSTLTITGAGGVTVTASQAGNTNYAAATPVAQTFTVMPAVLTVTANNQSRPFGQANPTLTYTITGLVNGDSLAVVSGTPGVSTTATTSSPAGTYPITIVAGTLAAANYTFTFVNGTLTVTGGVAQTITFPQPPDTALTAGPVTLTATASSTLPVSYTSTTLPVCTVSASSVTLVSAGTCSITANQAGNANFTAAAAVIKSFQVLQGTQTINFPVIPNHVLGDAPFGISATATSGLPVSFGSTTSAVCSVSGSTVTLVHSGQCSIQATQAGNATYAPAPPVTQSFQVNPATLVSIAVTPTNPSITKGATQQFTATGHFSDGTTQDLTASATWSSSLTTVATIGVNTGLTTSVGTGSTNITATQNAVTSNTAVLTVTPATLTSIAVTPANPSITKGATQQFTATGTFSDNSTQVLTNAAWASGTGTVATINATGLATAVGVGTSTISATSGSITGSTLLTVNPATLVSIAVTPANPAITKGATQQFTATGTFSDNSTQVLTSAVWASGTGAVATINATGLATAVGVGTSTISATSGSITGSTLLTVNPATLVSIAVTPANPAITKGATQQFTATGTFSDNSTQVLTNAVWASGTGAVATINTTGLATAVGAGSSTISATVGSITGSTLLTVNPATLVSIAVTPANPSITKGATQQFTATGTFSDNSTQVLTNAAWASGTGTVATINATGLATAVGVGTSTISATSGSITGSTLLTVNPATLVSIAVTPANPSITKGATQQFTATGTFSDSSTQVLTSAVWASGTGTVATINATGLATAVGVGTSTISATSGSITGSTLLTVNPAASITSLAPASGPVGTAVTITGTNFGAAKGTSTVTFNGTVATPASWSGTSIVVPVPTGATTGNVVVTVGGVASNGVSFTVVSAAPLAFVQVNYAVPQTPQTTVTVTYTQAQTAGNLNIVVVGWNDSTAQVQSVTDTKGNVYALAVGPTVQVGVATQSMYYAKNIAAAAAGGNTVTVTFKTGANFPDIRIAEYSGIDPSVPVDVVAAAQGSGTLSNSGSVTTVNANDLLVGANTVQGGTTGPGPGYTSRVITTPNGDILEDQVVTATGSYSATAPVAAMGAWIMQMVAFRAAGSLPPPPISVSISPATASVATGNGTQAFTATLQNDLQHQGVTWSLSGSGCAGISCGTLSQVTTTSVTYTGPANIPNPATVTLTATSVTDNTKTATATITVIPGQLTVVVSPKRGGLPVSQTISMKATVTNDSLNKGVTWTSTGGSFSLTSTASGVATTYTAPNTAGVYTLTATSVSDVTKSDSVVIGVTDLAGVSTYHNNLSRDGSNQSEYALTASNVTSTTFGKLFSCTVDGAIYAQPLWVANLTINGVRRNVVFVATQHESVYAFDADANASPCVPLWQANLIDSAHGGTAGETSVPSGLGGLVGSGSGDISPEVGITGTPVIDLTTNTIYVVSKSVIASGPTFFQRLHALDLTTGNEKFGGPVPIAASVAGTGDGSSAGSVAFDAHTENQRPGLALVNGIVYISWASHEDVDPYHGWIIGYNASTLASVSVFNDSPNGKRSGIWMGGGAPAADSGNNLYVITGNGTYDGATNSDYGDTFLKLGTSSGISVLDWFTPANQSSLEGNDRDFGAGGAAILVDEPLPSLPHLVIGGGKDGNLFLLNRNNMGRFNNTNQVVQTLSFGNAIFATPAFWQNMLYLAGVSGSLKAFSFNTTTGTFNVLSASQSSGSYGFPGATPSISASGASNGIVWAIDSSQYCTPQSLGCGPAVLHAYDATNLAKELWNSSQGSGNTAGNAVKFTVPTIANGKVYIGTRGNNKGGTTSSAPGELDVYGLMPD